MKKSGLFLLIIFIVILSGVLSLTACSNSAQLAVPQNLYLDGDILMWSAVPYANGYEISFDGELMTTDTPYYEIYVDDAEEHTFKVRALGEKRLKNSEFSEEIVYTKSTNNGEDTLTRIATPNITIINGEGEVMWRSITGAVGYRIYINNVVEYNVVGGDTTSYSIVISEPGNYSVQLQAVAETGKNLDSSKSAAYLYIIENDGTPRPPMLAKPLIGYDATKKALYWNKNPLAIDYAVYLYGELIEDCEFTYENNIVFYNLDLTEGNKEYCIKSVGDDNAYSDSLISNSLSFPLIVSAPPDSFAYEVDSSLMIVWDEIEYSVGYTVKLGEYEFLTVENCFDISGLTIENGEYLLKIKSVGDNIYYTSSPYSAEFPVIIQDGKFISRMSTPSDISLADYSLEWEDIENVSDYTLSITNLTMQTTETLIVTDNIYNFASDDTNDYIISIKANGNEFYLDSLWSGEIFARFSGTKTALSTPSNLVYTGEVFEWISVIDSALYLLIVDGVEIFVDGESYEYALTAGKHIVKVKTVSSDINYYDSCFTEEMEITVPHPLSSPEIEITENVLSYNAVDNAKSYRVYCNGNLIAENIFALSFDLDSAITKDGTYYIAVQAVGEDYFGNSPISYEILYTKTDAAYGTEEKPIIINTIEDFLAINDAPDAYYTISATVLDFETAGEKYDLEPLFNTTIPFRGVISGNGCVIKNINLVEKNGLTGIFGAINSAKIESIIFTDITLSGNLTADNAGILCSVMNDCVIDYVNITADIEVEGAKNIGAVAGNVSGDIKNSDFYINLITSGDNIFVGGIAGIINGNILNSRIIKTSKYGAITVNGNNIKAGTAAGKISGNADSITSNISLSVIGEGAITGGLVAYFDGDMLNCSYAGEIVCDGEGAAYIGGVTAIFEGEVNSVNVGGSITVDGETCFVGGVFANVVADTIDAITLSNQSISIIADDITSGGVYASGNVNAINNINVLTTISATGGGYIGGIVGICDAEISSGTIEATLTVNGSNLIVGGMSAKHSGNISDIDLNTNIVVTGSGFIGGVIGELSGNIEDVSLIGGITATGDDITVGGIAAVADGDISVSVGTEENSYILSITGIASTAGGVCGMIAGDINGDVYVDIDSDSGIVGGVAAIAEGENTVNVSSVITAGDGVVGGAFGKLLSGSIEGAINCELIIAGSLSAGGVVGENNAISDITADVSIVMSEGNGYIGALFGKDMQGATAALTCSIDATIEYGYIGGAVGYGNGIYDIDTVGDIEVNQTETGEYLYVGGIGGYLSQLEGSYSGDISVNGSELYVGGAAGNVFVANNVIVDANIAAVADTFIYCGGVAALADNADSCSAEGSLLTLEAPLLYAGMFGYCFELNNIVVSDITLSALADELYFGMFAGSAMNINNSMVGSALQSAIINYSAASGTAAISAGVGEIREGGTVYNSGIYADMNLNLASGTINAGGLASKGGIIDKCFVKTDFTIAATNATVGGISTNIGSADRTYFAGKIVIDADTVTAGGFTALGNGDITNCYSSAHIELTGETLKAGLFASEFNGDITSCYTTGSIESESAVVDTDFSNAELNFAYTDDLAVLSNYSGIKTPLGYNRCEAKGFDYNWILNENCYPILADIEGQITGEVTLTELSGITIESDASANTYLPSDVDTTGIFNMVTWVSENPDNVKIINGNIYCYSGGTATIKGYISGGAEAYSASVTLSGDTISGEGTELNPYIIDSIKWLHYLDSYKAAYFEITDDIALGSYDIFPIGSVSAPFTGNVEGNDSIISGLKISNNYEEAGFFGYIENAVIENIRFEAVDISLNLSNYVGIAVGYGKDSDITNVTAAGKISIANAISAGGIIGKAEGCSISSTGFNGDAVFSYCDYSGGLLGSAENCNINTSYSNVIMNSDGDTNYGGFVGVIDALTTVNHCYAANNISTNNTAYIGGFAYNSEGNIQNSYSICESNSENIGVFIYDSTGTNSDCYAVSPTFGVYPIVASGNDSGITILTLTNAVASLFEGAAEWTSTELTLPRLLNVDGQSEPVEPQIITDNILITNSDRLDLSDLIAINSGCFGVAQKVSSNTDILYFDSEGYAVILENAAIGELFINFTFEGGYTGSIGVEIANVENPDFASGYGTELSPYIIETAQQFGNIHKYAFAYFELQSNITLGSDFIKHDFRGFLNGNNYTITINDNSGLFINATGLINNININANIVANDSTYAATVAECSENFVFENADITYTLNAQNVTYAGGLVASAEFSHFNDIRLTNCNIGVTGSDMFVGGIAGYISGEMLGVNYYIENISGNLIIVTNGEGGNIGGIIGYSESAVADIDITINLTVSGTENLYVGGVAGYSRGGIFNSFVENSEMSVTADKTEVVVGGISGKANNINNCFVITSTIEIIVDIDDYNLPTEYGATILTAGGVAGIVEVGSVASFAGSELNINLTATDFTSSYDALSVMAGGIFGICNSVNNLYTDSDLIIDLDGSYNLGNNYITTYIGAVTGSAFSINSAAAKGSITTTLLNGAKAYAGGIVGEICGEYFENNAIVFAVSRVAMTLSNEVTSGGIAGINQATYSLIEQEEDVPLYLFINCHYDNEIYSGNLFGEGALIPDSYIDTVSKTTSELQNVTNYPEEVLIWEEGLESYYMDCWDRDIWTVENGYIPHFDGRLL